MTLRLLVVCSILWSVVPALAGALPDEPSGVTPGMLLQARPSPDSKTLALTILTWAGPQRAPCLQVYTATATGARPIPVTAPPFNSWGPVWQAGGHALFFLSDRLGPPQLFHYAPDKGGEATPVTSWPEGIHAFALSPSGQHLALVAYREKGRTGTGKDVWRPLGRATNGGNAEVLLMSRCAREQWCKPKPTGVYLAVGGPGFFPGPSLLPLAFLTVDGDERLVVATNPDGAESKILLLPQKQGGVPVTLAAPGFWVQSLSPWGAGTLCASGSTADGSSRLHVVSTNPTGDDAGPLGLHQPPPAAPDGLPMLLSGGGVTRLTWLGRSSGAWLHEATWSALPMPRHQFRLLDAWPYGTGDSLLLTFAHQDGSTTVERLRLKRPVCQRLLEGRLPKPWNSSDSQRNSNPETRQFGSHCGVPTAFRVGFAESAFLPALITSQMLNSLGVAGTLEKAASWWAGTAGQPSAAGRESGAFRIWVGPSAPLPAPASRAMPESQCAKRIWAFWPSLSDPLATPNCPDGVDVCVQTQADVMGMPSWTALKKLVLWLSDPHSDLERMTAQ